MIIGNQLQTTEIEKDVSKEEIEELNSFLSEMVGNKTSTKLNTNDNDERTLHPVITAGLIGAFLAHAAIILSLPPVIRGRGAPFLPTATKGLDAMFAQIRKQPQISQKVRRRQEVRFVDLGSGDGRVVFRAAREGMFSKCTGVEINPVLHAWAVTRRIVQASRYWAATNFALQDLWSVDLSKADVVAVYGLHPIMGDLGQKMRKEMKHGSIIVSNVFTIPGWKPIGASLNGVHLYSVPQCFREKTVEKKGTVN